MEIVTLYRPVGPKELSLIEASKWSSFPPRLPEQPIFYPVTNEEYAIQIARDWNVRDSGSGYVTAFDVDADLVAKYPRRVVGSRIHEELWIPAAELPEFNRAIIGRIRVLHTFKSSGAPNQSPDPSPTSGAAPARQEPRRS